MDRRDVKHGLSGHLRTRSNALSKIWDDALSFVPAPLDTKQQQQQQQQQQQH